MENKHKAVMEYLKEYFKTLEDDSKLSSILYFNSVQEENNHTSVNTIVSDTWATKYFRGGIKNYDFAMVLMRPYNTGTSDDNINEMFDIQKFMDWIDEQNKIKNFPIFEDGQVLSIQNLQNEPNLSGVNEAGDLAKYMFQIRIEYYKED
ncbi:MAG: hypothetical protein K2L15_04885 [Eubacteriales bacterium]|nr:hypothetical protein [Eubacteriales bacterium]